MRKLSSIQEGMWRSVVDRSSGEKKREEDMNMFDDALNKLKHMNDEFFKSEQLNDGVLWSPVNFGSDNIYEPGFFMGVEELTELKEYLEENAPEYKIPYVQDWHNLLSSNRLKVNKSGKCGIFYMESEQGIFQIPQFGYISTVPVKLDISSGIYMGAIYYNNVFGFEHITRNTHNAYVFKNQVNDKVQVRLIKRA